MSLAFAFEASAGPRAPAKLDHPRGSVLNSGQPSQQANTAQQVVDSAGKVLDALNEYGGKQGGQKDQKLYNKINKFGTIVDARRKIRDAQNKDDNTGGFGGGAAEGGEQILRAGGTAAGAAAGALLGFKAGLVVGGPVGAVMGGILGGFFGGAAADTAADKLFDESGFTDFMAQWINQEIKKWWDRRQDMLDQEAIEESARRFAEKLGLPWNEINQRSLIERMLEQQPGEFWSSLLASTALTCTPSRYNFSNYDGITCVGIDPSGAYRIVTEEGVATRFGGYGHSYIHYRSNSGSNALLYCTVLYAYAGYWPFFGGYEPYACPDY